MPYPIRDDWRAVAPTPPRNEVAARIGLPALTPGIAIDASRRPGDLHGDRATHPAALRAPA